MSASKKFRSIRLLVVTAAAAVLVLLGVPQARATSDPLWSQQYGPVQIGAPTAWQRSTGKGVKVAVVDTGVDVDHPDLKKNLDLADSHDFACSDSNPDDDSVTKDSEGKQNKGHGTHVTGTVAAEANNNVGVAGVAPDVKVMVEKVFASTDSCQPEGLGGLTGLAPMAINYAVSHGAKVINLSLDEQAPVGLTGNIQSACNNAFNKGTLCVVAAGNSGETNPSGYDYSFNGIVVTANDSSGRHASFGQKADTKWAVSAPGVAILSTWPIDDQTHDGYNSIQGTSMAAPHVTGAAAVLFGMGMNARQVAEKLVGTAGPPQRDSLVEGAGIIHLDRAAGFQPVTTTEAATGGTRQGGVTPVTRAGRSGIGGGQAPSVVTTTTTELGPQGAGTNFDEGLEANSRDIDALRLKQATRNGANRPFNAAGPLIVLSAIGALITVGVSVGRIRAKDAPPLT